MQPQLWNARRKKVSQKILFTGFELYMFAEWKFGLKNLFLSIHVLLLMSAVRECPWCCSRIGGQIKKINSTFGRKRIKGGKCDFHSIEYCHHLLICVCEWAGLHISIFLSCWPGQVEKATSRKSLCKCMTLRMTAFNRMQLCIIEKIRSIFNKVSISQKGNFLNEEFIMFRLKTNLCYGSII